MAGVPVLTALLLPLRDRLELDTALLLYLLAVVITSAVGGWPAALIGAVGGFMCANFFFTPPYGSLAVANRNELTDLLIFLTVAVLVAFTTEAGARSRANAERARLEAGWLAQLSSRDSGPGSLRAALADAREVFRMSAVALFDGDTEVSRVGAPQPGDVEVPVEAGPGLRLTLWGAPRIGEDRRLMGIIAATAGSLWRAEQQAAQAHRAEELARIDEVRVALLAAVGHDLRSPLAGIKASVSTLRQTDIEMGPDDASRLLAGIEENTDRLTDVVSNLLDMSRIQAGALSVHLRPTAVEETLEGPSVPPRESWSSTSARGCRWWRRIPGCSNRSWPTSSTTPGGSSLPKGGSASPRGSRTAACGSTSSTTARGCPQNGSRRFSTPSNASTTAVARAPGWAWPSRAASPRRWVVSWPRPRRPAEA